jgi:tripartite-type tricarboxylate transporter receptor subunit TctC
MRRRQLPLLMAAAASAMGRSAQAQNGWPSRTLRLVVTFPPGGSSDIVARVLAEAFASRLPQRAVVDNRPGAGGTLGAAFVASQPADGYTFLVSNTAPIVTSPPIYPQTTYDPVKSFTHIAYLGATPLVIMVNPRQVPASVTDLAGLVAWIKAQPAPPAYGSSGAGSVHHIFGEQLMARTGVRLTHVPYRGSSPMLADLLGGAIPLGFDTLPQNVETIRSGRLRAIAVTSPMRQSMAPEVPTTADAGYPGLTAENWLGLSAPAGLPAPIAARMFAEVQTALALPQVKARWDELGIALRPMTMAEFGGFVEEEVRVVGGAVRALGIRAD